MLRLKTVCDWHYIRTVIDGLVSDFLNCTVLVFKKEETPKR